MADAIAPPPRPTPEAKRHLRSFNGIPKQSFYLFPEEGEWRFNGGNHRGLLNQLKTWINSR